MTAVPDGVDTVMAAIGLAVARGHDGDAEGARRDLTRIWTDIETTGRPFHRCVLAHYLADLYPDPAAALVWDERALAAALAAEADPAEAAQLSGFFPSLRLNLADNHRRLGDFDAAAAQLARARELAPALPADGYGEQIRRWIDQVAELLAERSTSPLPADSGPG